MGWIILSLFMGIGVGGTCATSCDGLRLDDDEVLAGSRHRVGVISVVGPITDATETVRDLRRFAARSDLEAIVVRIDSPGGAVAPSQEVFAAMRHAAEDKPVVASMGTVAASGGFWIAMGADYIFASPGSITGSIGVISQTADLRSIAGTLGLQMRTYKSGPNKDVGNPFRDVTPADESVFMELTSDIYEQFVEAIATRRKLDLDSVRRIADGRVISGRRAHEAGLIDALGGFYDAVRKAAALAEEREAKEANRAAEAIEEDPTLVYPKKRGGGLLHLLAEEAGEGAADGASRGAARAVGAWVETITQEPAVRVEAR
ncbi:MAG: signal peptide peptidase SppA [Deltaproteobacteria bacterium]|nr:signal peptide peptidase SppA [Deltaproteobacteria bacterium]